MSWDVSRAWTASRNTLRRFGKARNREGSCPCQPTKPAHARASPSGPGPCFRRGRPPRTEFSQNPVNDPAHILRKKENKWRPRGLQPAYPSGRAAPVLRAAPTRVSSRRRLHRCLPNRTCSSLLFYDRTAVLWGFASGRAAVRLVLNSTWRVQRARGLDPYSSAPWFAGWRDGPELAYGPAPVVDPQTWLGTTGWRRRGPLSLTDEPRAPGERVPD